MPEPIATDDRSDVEERARLAAIARRISSIAADVGGQNRLASLSGVPQSTVNRLCSQGSGHFDNVLRIALATNTNLHWIGTGEGPRRIDGVVDLAGSPPAVDAIGRAGRPDEAVVVGDFVYIPRYDVRAAAGAGGLVDRERFIGRIAMRADFIRGQGYSPAQLAACELGGDSMEPTLRDGELLMIDLRANAPTAEGIHLLRLGEVLLVKRLQVRPDGGLTIISDNEARYPRLVIEKDRLHEVSVIGRVVWHAGTL